MRTIDWTVSPLSPPAVLRRCPKCAKTTSYRSSGLFRINAQQKKLDIWLIYKCEHCQSTWNMEIYARIKPTSLDNALYESYVSNDPHLALRCAVDRTLLDKNRAVADHSGVEYTIAGEEVDMDSLTTPVCVRLRCDCRLPVRVEKLLRQKLGLTRSRFAALAEQGAISLDGKLARAKLTDGMTVTLIPPD